MGLLHFLVLFMGLTVLFQLVFNFIYNTFKKKIQFQLNKLFPKGHLIFFIKKKIGVTHMILNYS